MSEMRRVGQYLDAPLYLERTVGRHMFAVFVYGAISAYGLIGTEHNGVGVVCLRPMRVVLDGDTPAKLGWYNGTGGSPTKEQVARFWAITRMTEAEFVQFVNSHPRARYEMDATGKAVSEKAPA